MQKPKVHGEAKVIANTLAASIAIVQEASEGMANRQRLFLLMHAKIHE
jgi:hypothetical protein